jgi:hypothetical protein
MPTLRSRRVISRRSELSGIIDQLNFAKVILWFGYVAAIALMTTFWGTLLVLTFKVALAWYKST